MDEVPCSQLTDSSKSLGPVKFGREVIEKNKSLLEEVDGLQKTASNKKTARKSVAKN